MNYFVLGNQYKGERFQVEYDFKWSDEQLDRTGIVSEFSDAVGIKTAQNTRYVSHWTRLDYHLSNKVNLFFVGMLDNAFWQTPQPGSRTKIREAWGYIPGIEIYPFKNFNLKIFGALIGRRYNYSGYAKQNLGATDSGNYRISVGIISPLTIL